MKTSSRVQELRSPLTDLGRRTSVLTVALQAAEMSSEVSGGAVGGKSRLRQRSARATEVRVAGEVEAAVVAAAESSSWRLLHQLSRPLIVSGGLLVQVSGIQLRDTGRDHLLSEFTW